MIDRRHALMAGALAVGLMGRHSLAAPPASDPTHWWVWGPEGVHGPAGFHPWATPPSGEPQSGEGALWWVDTHAVLHRWALNGAAHSQPLPALPSAWTPAPRGDGVLLAMGDEALLLGPTLAPTHRWPLRDLGGRKAAVATHALAHAMRRSLLLSLPGLGEVWELSLDPAAPPVFDGLVHDHRMGEAIARPGHYGVRRVPLREPGDEVPLRLHTVPGRPWVYGPVSGGMAVLNLDVRRRLVTLPLEGRLHAWQPAGDWLWLQQGPRLQAFDAHRWQPGPSLPLPSQGVQLLAQGVNLWLRDATNTLWCDSGNRGDWVRRGSARGMALSPTGALGLLDERWPTSATSIQAA